MVKMTTTINSRTWAANGTDNAYEVRSATKKQKGLNVSRRFCNATTSLSGLAAAVWGLSKLATEFAITTNRVTSYISSSPIGKFAIPVNLCAQGVKTGLEYFTITNLTDKQKKSGLTFETWLTVAGSASLLFNKVLKKYAVNHPFIKFAPPALTALSVGVAAYNAWTSSATAAEPATKDGAAAVVDKANDEIKVNA